MFASLYASLSIPQPDLVVYLKADEHTILSRVRKRQDPYMDEIDLTYVLRMNCAYDAFFRSYQGLSISIDTSQLDYTHPNDMHMSLQQMQTVFDIFSYLKPHPGRRKGEKRQEERIDEE